MHPRRGEGAGELAVAEVTGLREQCERGFTIGGSFQPDTDPGRWTEYVMRLGPPQRNEFRRSRQGQFHVEQSVPMHMRKLAAVPHKADSTEAMRAAFDTW